MPCVPIAGKQKGMFMVPQIGAGVWIEFEQGDPDYPIWVGGFWGSVAEVPAALAPPPSRRETIVHADDAAERHRHQRRAAGADAGADPAPAPPGTGGIVLKSPTGAMIIVNDTGIYINNGKGASSIMMGPTVMINNGALVVT